MTPGALFVNPLPIPWSYSLWLILPLCLAVAIVYKAVRTHDVRRLWIEIAGLSLYMVAGLSALGAGLWLIQEYWP
ncbi:MAG: hypothetical protein ACE15C_08580 [Phycisphaerae bacterium]